MADLDEYMYRAEQLVIWEQRANVEQIQAAFGVTATKAMKILLTLEYHGLLEETDVEGEYRVLRTRAINAIESNREMHTLLNAAVRYIRDCGTIQKNDLEKFCIVLGITEPKAVELMEILRGLGVLDEVVMYQALTSEEVSDQGYNWYDPYESSLQLMDEDGSRPLVCKADADDAMYAQVEKYVIDEQKVSASLLQKRFRMGYARAARLMDALEQNGIVSGSDGSNPRKVLKRKFKPKDMTDDEA